MTNHPPSDLRRISLPAAFVAASIVSLAAHRARFLTRSGAIAATAVGAVTAFGSGACGVATMIAFFATSSLLGKLPGPTTPIQGRGNRRDAVQVLANGGVPALLSLAMIWAPQKRQDRLRAGFAGAVAAAAADTWATEIGSRFGQEPRTIIGLRPAPLGASGAVTVPGITASVLGASLVAAIFAGSSHRRARWPTIAVGLGGITGSLVDSVIGAALQEVRFCQACGLETEVTVHSCGNITRHLRGQPWCTNDVVNTLGTASGALITLGIDAVASYAEDRMSHGSAS